MEGNRRVTGTFGAGTDGHDPPARPSSPASSTRATWSSVARSSPSPPRPARSTRPCSPGPRANYTITQNADGSVTVADGAGTRRHRHAAEHREPAVLRRRRVDRPAGDADRRHQRRRSAASRSGRRARRRRSRSRTAGCNPLTLAADEVHAHRDGRRELRARDDRRAARRSTSGASCRVQVTFKPVAPAGAKSANAGRDEQLGRHRRQHADGRLTGTATAAPPQAAGDGHPGDRPARGDGSAGRRSPPRIGTMADRQRRGASRGTSSGSDRRRTGRRSRTSPGGDRTTFQIPLLPLLDDGRAAASACMATFTDGLGQAEGPLTVGGDAAGDRVAGGALCAAAAAGARSPRLRAGLTPLGQATAPLLAPAPLAAACA